jgi:glycosyltransferase involved in cell wall biosynthesis
MSRRRVLALYMEPAPYVEALAAELGRTWRGELAVRYIGRALSQPWKSAGEETAAILPAGRIGALSEIRRLIGALAAGDIVHLCGWGHSLLLAALLLAKRRGLRIVVESDTTVTPWTSAWKSLLKRKVYPVLFQQPHHFLPGGTRQAAFLAAHGVGRDRMTLAHMTVDVASMMAFAEARGGALRAAKRIQLGLGERDVVCLFVGRLEPHKGILLLLEAFGQVSEWRPEARLIIAGGGSLSNDVQAAARRNSAIAHAGRLEGEDLWACYLAADLLVLPSLFEPWGLVVNEAMAFGLPVIVSDAVGSAADLLPQDEEGAIVPAGDAAALARTLDRMITDPALRQACSAAGQRRIAPWTLANEAMRIVSVWERLQ